MSNQEAEYLPQDPARKWVVSKTGHFWQERVTPQACAICGEVRTFSKTYKAGAVVYNLRYFTCLHPQKTTKVVSPSEPPASR